MDDHSQNNPDSLSLTDQQLSEIDQICDRFDQELVGGLGPVIETFLADVSPAVREAVLAELLAMEIEFRNAKADQPEQEEYARRFPPQASFIAGLFEGVARTRLFSSDTTRLPDDHSTEFLVDASALIQAGMPAVPSNFRLIEELGRGGMGVVWLAEQDEPVKRRVALKLIKLELASKEVIARFDAEKQALAMMNHPNIAKVLDAGTTNDGRPYFVMEMVDGVHLTRYCDDNKLSVDERLKLFVLICKAVQHAHVKGIIHRDLKPSNVLVTVIDGEAVPKVIDFGLAKAVKQDLEPSDMTMLTEFGKVVGTVQYMSPEQAELRGPDAEDIDTRTDVYSLGVMLYELLTGSTPLDRETLGQNALLKVLEIIREVDPPRPSNRLSNSVHEVNSEVGSRRGLHPERLRQILRGELDWVVMKALEKDRARRYQTANDLAQDLSNYLAGDAVSARPPSTWYQLQKFASRNRGVVAATLAIGVVLIAGIAGTSYGLIQANEKTEIAQAKTREANAERGHALTNQRRAIEAEDLASAAARHARDSEAAAYFQLANARWDAGRAREARDLIRQIPTEYRDHFEWRFCNRKFDGSDVTCYGHSMAVRSVAFSPDGTRVVTASNDANIKIWDAVSGQEIASLPGNQGPLHAVIFSSDGTRIVSTGRDKTIKIWDAQSGQSVATLIGHQEEVLGIAFSPNDMELVSVSMNSTVKRWDVRSEREIYSCENRLAITDVAFSPNTNRFVTCGNSVVILWDATTGKPIARQDNAVRWPLSIAFSPDGRYIAAAGYDVVALWNAELTQQLWTANGKAGWIHDLAFSPDGARIASTGERDNQVRVWDVRSGLEIMALVGHSDAANAVTFSPDGARLASAGNDHTVRLWDARTGHKRTSIRAHNTKVHSLAFSNDDRRLASVGQDGSFKLWDLATCLEIAQVNGANIRPQEARCVAFSPNDAYVAFGGADNSVRLLDGNSGEELKSFHGHQSWICGVAFDPHNELIVSAGDDHLIKLWDIDSGEEMATLKGHAGRVNSVAISPDGDRIASASQDGTIKLWDLNSGQEILSLEGHGQYVFDVAFSPDGREVASASNDTTIQIWDAQSGKMRSRLRGHSSGVIGVVFSPAGKRLASTSYDGTLKLWDTQTGRELATVATNSYGTENIAGSNVHNFSGVAFSPDGTRIAAGMDNGIITFLDGMMEQEVQMLRGHTDALTQWSFSDDGARIYSASNNEKLCWDLTTKQPDPDAAWEPPTEHSPISPDGRWLIGRDENHLLLVDLEFKNTPSEKRYRAIKARFEPEWHQEQTKQSVNKKDWYAAAFHFALLMKNDPFQANYYDGLHSSLQELRSQYERQDRDLEPYLATVVQESLQFPRGNDSPNHSFEEPQVRIGSFGFREAVPGWKTTGKLFEIWSTGFLSVDAHDGQQFVELNANEDATLYKDSTGIQRGAAIEFSFAHRGRNGDDTLKLTITDLGADHSAGGGDDKELFAKEFTTGNHNWTVYDSTTENAILALGNKVRFAFTAVEGTGGKGPDKTEGNFLDAAKFGVDVVTSGQKTYGLE